jgi:hypothetical protein
MPARSRDYGPTLLATSAAICRQDTIAAFAIAVREAYRISLSKGMYQRKKAMVFCATQLHTLAMRHLINQTSTTTA